MIEGYDISKLEPPPHSQQVPSLRKAREEFGSILFDLNEDPLENSDIATGAKPDADRLADILGSLV